MFAALVLSAFIAYENPPVAAPVRIPHGCPDFEIALPRDRGGPVIRATDYGFSAADTNNAAAINRALAAAREVGASRLELAPGEYRCFGPEGIVLDAFSDFTIDGKGAVLVFRRPRERARAVPQWEMRLDHANMLLKDCLRVRVANVSLDWDWEHEPLGTFVKVVAKHEDGRPNESWVEYETVQYARHPSYPEPVPVLVVNGVSATLDRFVPQPGMYFQGPSEGHFGAKNIWVAPNRLRVWPFVMMPDRMQDHRFDRLFSADANRRVVKETPIGQHYRLQHFYYGENGVCQHSCAHTTLQNVHILSCRGMGFQESGRQHHWQFLNCSVAPPAGVRRPFSSTADAHHVAQSRGWCKMIGCRWAWQQDDANNFHDRTTMAMKYGERELEVVNLRGAAFLGAGVGDELELREDDFSVPTSGTWRGKVVAVRGDVYEMARAVPRERGSAFVVMNRSYGTDNLILRDCLFEDTAARNLLHGSNVTIENCIFRRTCGTPLRFLAVWSYNVWCEGNGCSNVVVRGCTFDSNQVHHWAERGHTSDILTCAMTPQACDPWQRVTNPRLNARLAALGRKWSDEVVGWQPIISDILVEKCRFLNSRGLVWHMADGDNLIFRDSDIIIDASDDGNNRPYRGKVLIDHATHVSVSGIRVLGGNLQ